MSEPVLSNNKQYEEFTPKYTSGMGMLILNIFLILASIAAFVYGVRFIERITYFSFGVTLMVVSLFYVSIVSPILFAGLKVLKPKEALVLTLFGKYHGTLKSEGFYFVNPFVVAVNPGATLLSSGDTDQAELPPVPKRPAMPRQINKKISLKAMTLNNQRQKINDELGNPIIIGIVVIWRVVNTAKAVFNVDNYKAYLSIQCDSALRNIVRLYPYDVFDDNDNEKTLRGSSQEIADKIKDELQRKTEIAGLEIIEARITHLSYSQEIAAAMLQRQHATAFIAARQKIVEGAVGMVQMALEKLNEQDVVQLDEERKAAMVSNLLVVLCGNRDVQPVVNSGTIY